MKTKKGKWAWVFAGIISIIIIVAVCMDCCCICEAEWLSAVNRLAKCPAEMLGKSSWLSLREKLKDSDIGKPGLLISMAGIGNAIVIFLYGRYYNGVYGIASEKLISHKVGKRGLGICRCLFLLLPLVAVISCLMQGAFLPAICAVLLYIVVGILIFLSAGIMSKEKNKKQIQKMLKDEFDVRVRYIQRVIMIETECGYKVLPGKENRVDEGWKSRKQIYQGVRSEILCEIFQSCQRLNLQEILGEIYKTIIKKSTQCFQVGFFYLYDLVEGVLALEGTKKGGYDWRITFVEEMVNYIDCQMEETKKQIKTKKAKNKEKSRQDLEQIVLSNYEGQFMAVICAILTSNDSSAEAFLWNGFFSEYHHRTGKLGKHLFIIVAVCVEFLGRNSIDHMEFYRLVYENKIRVRQRIEIFEEEDWVENEKYSFILAMLGLGSQREAEQCLKEIRDDLENVRDVDHIPVTIIGNILREKESSKSW